MQFFQFFLDYGKMKRGLHRGYLDPNQMPGTKVRTMVRRPQMCLAALIPGIFLKHFFGAFAQNQGAGRVCLY